ncbi:hypothetical protein FD754_013526 [Muntiacus muntjak]|uniref:Uncharacterized protein n=1 Tax=Muntiacus muntjak TaxID=9888 RepID=A0A5N3VHC1_MUNMU|nr:hypothetical protein FD754_013526 [Muntiacus muntjak]
MNLWRQITHPRHHVHTRIIMADSFHILEGLPGGSDGKESAYNAGDLARDSFNMYLPSELSQATILPNDISYSHYFSFMGCLLHFILILGPFDMQRITLEELKHILYHAFRDHLTMKDIENIIINEEESLNETSGNCQTEFEGVHMWGLRCIMQDLLLWYTGLVVEVLGLGCSTACRSNLVP